MDDDARGRGVQTNYRGELLLFIAANFLGQRSTTWLRRQ
jgi:hypothetical protein